MQPKPAQGEFLGINNVNTPLPIDVVDSQHPEKPTSFANQLQAEINQKGVANANFIGAAVRADTLNGDEKDSAHVLLNNVADVMTSPEIDAAILEGNTGGLGLRELREMYDKMYAAGVLPKEKYWAKVDLVQNIWAQNIELAIGIEHPIALLRKTYDGFKSGEINAAGFGKLNDLLQQRSVDFLMYDIQAKYLGVKGVDPDALHKFTEICQSQTEQLRKDGVIGMDQYNDLQKFMEAGLHVPAEVSDRIFKEYEQVQKIQEKLKQPA